MNKSPNPFIGQEKVINGLLLQIEAAKIRNAPVSHFLMSGPDNMGKSTLAIIAANMMEVNIRITTGTSIATPSDLAAILTNLRQNDFLLIDQLELLQKAIADVLIPAMTDFTLDIVIGKGSTAKNVRLNLPHFTVVGLSSQPRHINKGFQNLFLYHYEFEPYNQIERGLLIDMFIKGHGQTVVPEAANLLANYCKGTIDNIQSLAKKVADYCLVKFRSNQIEYNDALSALDSLGYFDASNSSSQIIDLLCKMTGIEFENFMADLFLRMGYKVEITQATGDHGIDLFLKHGSEAIAVQCKRWSQPVGEPIIRDFYGALLNSGVPNGLIVTTTTFTPQARSFKQGKPIDLIDIDRLVLFVKQFYPKSS